MSAEQEGLGALRVRSGSRREVSFSPRQSLTESQAGALKERGTKPAARGPSARLEVYLLLMDGARQLLIYAALPG